MRDASYSRYRHLFFSLSVHPSLQTSHFTIVRQPPWKGWSPIEYRSNLHVLPVHTSVCPAIHLPPSPPGLSKASISLLDAGWSLLEMLDQVLEGEKCTNVHMDIQILPLYYRTFSPFLTKAEKAGQGCQWPSLPSGRLVHTLLALLVSFASLSIPTSLSFYIIPFQLNIQSNPTVMDRKGLKFFFSYWWNSVIANTWNKEKLIHGTKKSFQI